MRYSLIILILFSLCACSPDIKPIKIPESNFEKTKAFELDKIDKPERPDHILLDNNFNKTKTNPKYVAFSKNEFGKIVALSKAFDNQGKMLDSAEKLVNIKIQEINALKELVSAKESLAKHISVLYYNEQEMRQLEQQNYRLEKVIDRVFFVIQSGVIVALAFAI